MRPYSSIYERIADEMTGRIKSGEFPPNGKLPSGTQQRLTDGSLELWVILDQSLLNGAFTIINFPDHPAVAFAETLTGDQNIEGNEEVKGYTLAFDYLRATAASVEESREVIARAREMI